MLFAVDSAPRSKKMGSTTQIQ